MTGIDSLLDLLSFIEGFVKTCRAIKEYKELDASYSALMTRAILSSMRLKHLTDYIPKNPSPSADGSQDYMTFLVKESRLSMERASRVLSEWKRRLHIEDDAAESRLGRLIPPFLKRLGHRLKCLDVDIETEKTSYMRERLADVEYMTIGKLEVESAMNNMDYNLTVLHFSILSSRLLSASADCPRGSSDDDDIRYVLRAKKRVESNFALNFVDRTLVKPLTDIDPDMPTGIFRSKKAGPYSGCIVDPRDVNQYAGENIGIAWAETRNIARLLAEDPDDSDWRLSSSVGILPSCGYAQLDTHLHAIIFRLPPGISTPRTLRSLLVEGIAKHSLADRVDLAIKLSKCVLVVHSLGLVHKSIRPDSIIVTESCFGHPNQLYPYKLGTPYLLAYDSSRTNQGTTMKHPLSGPEGHLWQILYRHPRHFPDRVYRYEMRDDIYSLGICLFEVALWRSLFRWNQSKGAFAPDRDVLDLSTRRCHAEAEALKKPESVSVMWLRRHLVVEAAKEMIPPIMGDLFKDVVVACLTFGTPYSTPKSEASWTNINSNFKLSSDNQSIHFVREVLAQLRSIRLS